MLKIVDISKKMAAFQLSTINVEVEKNDYFILLGNSGAGKSILLEIISGITKPDSGKLFLEGKDITWEPVNKRDIGFLFQDCALFPHLSVKNNIAFPLKIKKENQNTINQKVSYYAEIFNIVSLLNRYPETLSGGEKQRVALARTLILEPKILLLDEPLSSLDQKNKLDSKLILKKLHREGLTIIHVTHSYKEALALGTKIAIIDNGKLLQSGKPQEIFHKPSNEFVAFFVGNKNFYQITTIDNSNKVVCINNTNIHLTAPNNRCFDGQSILIENQAISIAVSESALSAGNNIFTGVIKEIFTTYDAAEILIDMGIMLYYKYYSDYTNIPFYINQKVWIRIDTQYLT